MQRLPFKLLDIYNIKRRRWTQVNIVTSHFALKKKYVFRWLNQPLNKLNQTLFVVHGLVVVVCKWLQKLTQN